MLDILEESSNFITGTLVRDVRKRTGLSASLEDIKIEEEVWLGR